MVLNKDLKFWISFGDGGREKGVVKRPRQPVIGSVLHVVTLLILSKRLCAKHRKSVKRYASCRIYAIIYPSLTERRELVLVPVGNAAVLPTDEADAPILGDHHRQRALQGPAQAVG